MAKDMNKMPFDEASKLKLDIFGECFEEWLPVFIYSKFFDKIYIFDFFAGSGKDSEGNYGSPLVLLDKAKGDNRKYCLKANKPIIFAFNEGAKAKSKELKANIEEWKIKCRSDNGCGTECKYRHTVANYDFHDVFETYRVKDKFNKENFGKFVLLDQYGFSQVDDNRFKELVSYPSTDFIFFISSSFIRRFKKHRNTEKYINTSALNFDESKPCEVHRIITDYFRGLIPQNKEYYLHHFTIKKGSNYYGLIFGTSHTLGMEKFLKVCWSKDKLSGEANFPINGDFCDGVFAGLGESIKRDSIKEKLKSEILSGKITSNRIGLKSALCNGCEPKLFTEVVKELEKEGRIERKGSSNYISTNIHKVEEYKIKVLNHGA